MTKSFNTIKTPRCEGFTLIEFLVSVTLIGIITSLAAPEYSSWIKGLRLTKASDTIHASMIRARSEAQRTQGKVTLCRSGNVHASVPTCGGATTVLMDWSHGWLVYTSATIAAAYDPLVDTLLAVVDVGVADNKVTLNASSAARPYLTYGADGRINTGSPVFAVCDNRNAERVSGEDFDHGQRISFTASGRPVVESFKSLIQAQQSCTP